MNNHDPLCRAYYQRYTDPKDCASCDLIWAVREDDRNKFDTNIGKLEAAYKLGYENAKQDSISTVGLYFEGVPSLARVHVNALCKAISEMRNNEGS
jgi:hypothetical protein